MPRIHMAGIFLLHNWVCIFLHDHIDNLSKMSEIWFCTIKWGLKGQNSDQTFFNPQETTYLRVIERVKIMKIVYHKPHTNMAGIFLQVFMCLHFFLAWSDRKSLKDVRDYLPFKKQMDCLLSNKSDFFDLMIPYTRETSSLCVTLPWVLAKLKKTRKNCHKSFCLSCWVYCPSHYFFKFWVFYNVSKGKAQFNT